MSLENDIAAFDLMRSALEAEHRSEWALFHAGELVATYPDFEAAATVATKRFPDEDCLIRQIGVSAIQLSGGLVFRPKHALGTSGL